MKITRMLTSLAIGIGVLEQATPTDANLLKRLRKNFLRGNGDGGDAAAAAIEAHDRLLQMATSSMSMSMTISDIDNIALSSRLPIPTDEITELVEDMQAEDIDISLSTAMTIMASSSDNLPAYHHGSDNFCVWFVNKIMYHLPLPHTHKHVDGTGGKYCPYLLGKLCGVKPTPTTKPSTSTTTLKPTDNQSSNPTDNPSSTPILGDIITTIVLDTVEGNRMLFEQTHGRELLPTDECTTAFQTTIENLLDPSPSSIEVDDVVLNTYATDGDQVTVAIVVGGKLPCASAKCKEEAEADINEVLTSGLATALAELSVECPDLANVSVVSVSSSFCDVASDCNGPDDTTSCGVGVCLSSGSCPPYRCGTLNPTENPTHSPSLTPTHTPTHTPTLFPTANPSSSPVETCSAVCGRVTDCVGETCTEDSDCCGTSGKFGEFCSTKARICWDKTKGYSFTDPILDCTMICTDSSNQTKVEEDCAGLNTASANIGCVEGKVTAFCTVESRNNAGQCKIIG